MYTWQLISRVLTTFNNNVDDKSNQDPDRYPNDGNMLLSRINIDYLKKVISYLPALDSLVFT